MLLFVGDDWAEQAHYVELQDQARRGLARAKLPEGRTRHVDRERTRHTLRLRQALLGSQAHLFVQTDVRFTLLLTC